MENVYFRFPHLPPSVTSIPPAPPPPSRAPIPTTQRDSTHIEDLCAAAAPGPSKEDKLADKGKGNYANVPVNGSALPLRDSPSDEVEESDLVPVYVSRPRKFLVFSPTGAQILRLASSKYNGEKHGSLE